MNILSAENVGKSFSEKLLFQNITYGISKGQRVALVGINGSGKTTLLNVLAGKIPPDEGLVSIRKDTRVGYLGQVFDFDFSKNIEENVFDDQNSGHKLVKAYEIAMTNPDISSEEMQDLIEKMEAGNLWDFETKMTNILDMLGISDLSLAISSLSGGQLRRVALAKVLLEDPDLLILDEPTNHLDLEVIEWLEKYLANSQLTLLMVTHDRYFLDNVANEIIELDGGKLHPYKGNYAYFLEKKADREQMEIASAEKARNTLKKELEWMRRQPKARGTKAKYRIEAFYELQEKAKGPALAGKVELEMKQQRQGGRILETYNLNKSYKDKLLVENFSYLFKKGDKIGIVGPNGVGKSTFLNMLVGEIKPDSGEIEVGQNTVYGYFKQTDIFYKDDERVIDIVKNIAENITLPDGSTVSASVFLTRFLFPPAVQYGMVNKLSGGEKKSLQLLLTIVKNPNFLILDEPTNDLDIGTLNVLEEFLSQFQGTLIIVSHDRYFMDNLVEHLFVFEGNGYIRDFPGNYTDYRDWMDDKEEQAKVLELKNKELEAKKQSVTSIVAASQIAEPIKKVVAKLSFKEQKEYESLEKEIEKLEKEKTTLVDKLTKGSDNFEELNSWSKAIEDINNQLDEKGLRWLELSERV